MSKRHSKVGGIYTGQGEHEVAVRSIGPEASKMVYAQLQGAQRVVLSDRELSELDSVWKRLYTLPFSSLEA
jgi:hypothetical protein